MISFEEIEGKSCELGFDDVAITDATIPAEDQKAYETWLLNGKHADLAYMENRVRLDPQMLLPDAQSAIMFLSYYKKEPVPFTPKKGLIASYARGRDYHNIHRKRLRSFIKWLTCRIGGSARAFSDSTPILEKALAAQSGLAFFGKNTLLIHRRFGTFFLLSGILTTIKLPGAVHSTRIPRCGVCRKCLDACPTNALTPYELDAAKCLSYHLIESKKPISDEIAHKNPGYIFGCDICQDACPHNRLKPLASHPDFASTRTYLDLSELQLASHDTFFGSPLNRKGTEGLKKTAELCGF